MGLGVPLRCPLPTPARRPLRRDGRSTKARTPSTNGNAPVASPRSAKWPIRCGRRCRGGFRSARHKAQWKSTLATYAAPLRDKPVDTIATDDALAVLKPIWTVKAETASRVRGRIEKVLDAAKAKGFQEGEKPARWRGHLDHLFPSPSR